MEFTSRGIPINLRPALQEYDLGSLDPEADAFTLIERTLAYGGREELRWLFQRYGSERLSTWVQEVGWRMLPRRRLSFWIAYFDLGALPARKSVWPH